MWTVPAAALTLSPARTQRSGEAVRAQVGCWPWVLGPHLWVGFEAEPEGVSEYGQMRHKSGPRGPHTKRRGAENRGRDLEGAARPRRVGVGSCSHRPRGAKLQAVMAYVRGHHGAARGGWRNGGGIGG